MSTERKRAENIEIVPVVDTDNAASKQCGRLAGLKPFKPGQSGNPKGRPKSARSKLGENFLSSFADDFEKHGAGVIVKVREERPADYLKIVASLLPREAHISTNPLEELSEDELSASINYLLTMIRPDGGDHGAA